MKKLSFLLPLCLLVLLAFPLCAPAQESSPDYDTAWQCVAEAGFPMENMDAETLFSIYEEIKDADSVITNTEREGLALAEQGQSAAQGNISSGDLTFSITTGKVISDGEISSVTVYVYYEWEASKPLIGLEDAISVNWDEDFIFKDNSFTAKHYSIAGALKESLSRPSRLNQQGLGWFVDLQNSSIGSYGNGHFSLIPRESMQDGTRYSTAVMMEYSHEKLSLKTHFLPQMDSADKLQMETITVPLLPFSGTINLWPMNLFELRI